MMKVLRFICFLSFVLYGSSSSVPKTIKNTSSVKDEKNYRLPTNIIPERYDLELSLTNESFVTKRYEGSVKIQLHILNETTKTIQMHSSRQNISHIEMINTDNSSSLTANISGIDNDTSIMTIHFVEDLSVGANYSLKINYTGTLDDDDMYGFYQSTYRNSNGEDILLATTQFESIYARRAFPCFDEPQFKAVFALTFNHPNQYKVLSNTNVMKTEPPIEGITTTYFNDSPLMSTYLVAFIMSDFNSLNATNGKFKVWSRPDSADHRSVAAGYGPKILVQLGKTLGIDFYEKMLPKMDVVAIPDFAAGAMENWGLVTYREIDLLDDGPDTSDESRQRILSVITHEFAHQWFGDYVTLDWWSNTWLNEGFATYFGNLVSDKIEPDFGIMDQFVINVLQDVFQTDSVKSALPLSSLENEINSLPQIENKFDDISYSKGGSILRMMNYFIGEDAFLTNLTNYLNTNAHQNGNPSALLKNFKSPLLHVKMDVLMDSWIYKPGLPIVSVSVKDNNISFTQERYLLADADENDTQWYIPISYTTTSSKKQFGTDPADYMFLEPNKTLSVELNNTEWIIVNNKATGYYRTNYDADLWARIIAVLKSNDTEKIQELNRAQLIDDIFNLARIGKIHYNTVFELAAYLEKESNYYAWTSAFNAFSFLLKRTGPKSSLGKAISKRTVTLMDTLLDQTTNATPNKLIDELNAVQAQKWSCNLGNGDCIADALEQFKTYKDDPTNKPKPNDRAYIYCTALLNSPDIKGDWNFLWEQFIASKSAAEQTLILTTLGCTADTDILKRYLEKSIDSTSGIRKQDAASVFKSVYSGTPEGIDVAFKFLEENYEIMEHKYKGWSSLSAIISGIADRFTTADQLQRLMDFIGKQGLPDEFKEAAEQALDTAKANVKWLYTYRKDLEDALGLTSGANAIYASIPLIAGLIIFLFNINP